MKRLLCLVAFALFCTACQTATSKKNEYYKDYYQPEGAATPQEQTR